MTVAQYLPGCIPENLSDADILQNRANLLFRRRSVLMLLIFLSER